MKKGKFFGIKFAVVALAAGFFSPSVDIKTASLTPIGDQIATAQMEISLFAAVEARSVNRNVSRGGGNYNVNRNVNRNVNVNYNGGRYYGGSYYRGGAVAAGVVTGLAIGSIVASVPPSCVTVYRNGIAYRNCGGTYYEPYYQGSTVSYRVVAW